MIDMSNLVWDGTFQITIETPYKRKTISLHNMITDAGLNYMRDLLDGTVNPPTSIQYIALGTSNTPVSASDTKLGNEVFRKAVTKQETPGTGQVQTTCYIAPYEANVDIEEIGVFAGPEATDAKDSGVMIARVLWSHTKNELESLQIVRTDTIGRA
ncbi:MULTISPECIES: hypothetical protein [Thermoanaerobacterium]|uniref:Uncharacterized protein n=2 Tax=Thermoanaerobacterium TaxID=28895 RepID=W9E7X7_9THEO|nr:MULTISPECIES: hypothetical protein [Thermoanaerobacterium]AFK87412.1 hypothetical protein Tsac_2414 [Thermoanaerobacterium saccharolyticum JW/SL-YS485]ETO37783.1 hypothetical protein V518_2037 [Thermoanaerobacterium aotearoense SCUT27]